MIKRRNTKSHHVSSLPLAIAGIMIAAMFAHPIVGVIVACVVAGSVFLAFIGALVWTVKFVTSKASARVTRDKKRGKWIIEFR